MVMSVIFSSVFDHTSSYAHGSRKLYGDPQRMAVRTKPSRFRGDPRCVERVACGKIYILLRECLRRFPGGSCEAS